MSTIYVFDQELSQVDAIAQNDVILLHDTSTGLKKYATIAQAMGSIGIVTTTATSLSLTAATHAGRRLIINTNSTVANAFNLPAATGSGDRYEAVNGLVQTQGSIVFNVNGSDVFKGVSMMFDSSALATHATEFFTTNATKITWNLTGKGGGVGRDKVVFVDEASGAWGVEVFANCIAAPATPFS